MVCFLCGKSAGGTRSHASSVLENALGNGILRGEPCVVKIPLLCMYVRIPDIMSTSTPVTVPAAAPPPEEAVSEHPCRWPRDLLEAYARYPGPYTIENAETILKKKLLNSTMAG